MWVGQRTGIRKRLALAFMSRAYFSSAACFGKHWLRQIERIDLKTNFLMGCYRQNCDFENNIPF